MGVWLIGFSPSPFLGSASDLVRTRGGCSGRVVGVCTPRSAMRWLALAVSERTRAMGPTSERPGAYRSVGLRFAVALTFQPFKGATHLKGMLEGDCAVVCGSPATSDSWPRCAGFAGPGRTVWRVQSCIANLAPPGRRLSDQCT